MATDRDGTVMGSCHDYDTINERWFPHLQLPEISALHPEARRSGSFEFELGDDRGSGPSFNFQR